MDRGQQAGPGGDVGFVLQVPAFAALGVADELVKGGGVVPGRVGLVAVALSFTPYRPARRAPSRRPRDSTRSARPFTPSWRDTLRRLILGTFAAGITCLIDSAVGHVTQTTDPAAPSRGASHCQVPRRADTILSRQSGHAT